VEILELCWEMGTKINVQKMYKVILHENKNVKAE
jgi:hypothetical protein